MAGHVNMMDDVLIAQLPPSVLRSALRALVSRGASVQRIFVQHVRDQLTNSPQPLCSAKEFFGTGSEATLVLQQYLAYTRCLFSSKMVQDSIPYLTHIIRSVVRGCAHWTANSALERTMESVSGDIVQALQALKESAPIPSSKLQNLLVSLHSALLDCNVYCASRTLSFPFTRAQRQLDDALSILFPNQFTVHWDLLPSLSITKIDPAISKRLEYFQLGALRLPRLFNGLWQMSSPAWGSASNLKQDAELTQLVRAGFIATDMADHYGDAELAYGSFRNRLVPDMGPKVIAATKWCIFRPLGVPVSTTLVLNAVKERSRRLGGPVELLQFHWYDYRDKDYLLVLAELVGITKLHPALVSCIGLCNFDADHTQEACEYLLANIGEVGIVSNQVQYSLIDTRPMAKMTTVCQKFGIKLLTYGSFCGGFLAKKWLGKPSPDIYSESSALTPSQRKYFDMISTWGDWKDFQRLLRTLNEIAENHGVGVSNVACRWVLDRPAVGAVIVGTRLGVSSNVNDNLRTFNFELTDADNNLLAEVALGTRAETLWKQIGDCGHEYKNMY